MKMVIITLLVLGYLSKLHGSEKNNTQPVDWFVPITEGAKLFLEAKATGDQVVLAEIARDGGSTWAVHEISDKDLLADLAKNAKHRSVRYHALQKINDQAVFEAVAKNDSDLEIRQMAVLKITNQEFLTEIVKSDALLRGTAIWKLDDKNLLADYAQNDENEWVRLAAAQRLDDQAIIEEIARNTNDGSVRRSAIRNLTDKIALLEFYKNDTDAGVRFYAVQVLDDQALIAEFIKNIENGDWRRDAVRKLNDQALLAELSENDKSELVRYDATHRLAELSKKNETADQKPGILLEIKPGGLDKIKNDEVVAKSSVENEILKNETSTSLNKWLYVVAGVLFLFIFSAVFLFIRKLKS